MKKYDNNPDEINEDKVLRRAFSGSVIKQVDPDKRQIEFIISNASVDRMGDIIEVNGWDLKPFKLNPVVLFGHMSSIPPIGKAVKTWKDKDSLRSVAEFIPRDISPFAHSIFRMYEEKFLHAVSVGFRPLKWERIEDEDGNETWSFRFKKQELLEFSAVPIPANPEALIQARQKGIDTAPFKSFAEEILDRWNETEDPMSSIYGVDKKFMETIRRRAAGAGTTYHVPPDVQDEIMKRNLEAIRKAKDAKKKNAITIRGLEVELPTVDPTKMKIGELVFTEDEVNGKKSLHIDKADESVLFTKEALDDEAVDFLNVNEVEEDGEKEAVVTIKSDEGELQYTLVGATADGNTIHALKSKDFDDILEAMQDAEVVDLTGEDDDDDESASKSGHDDDEDDEDDKGKGKKKPKPDDDDDDDDDEDKSDDDDDDDDEEDKGKGKKKPKPDDDDDDDDEKSDDDDDDDDEDKGKGKKPKKKPKPDDDDDDEEDKKSKKGSKKKSNDEDDAEPMDLPTHMIFIEEALVGFEESLDSLGEKGHTRREERRLAFLASFMRDLADRLDGGVKPTKSVTTTSKDMEEEQEDALTPEQAQEYLKSVTDQLSPLLTEMVKSKLSKLRGRLD